MTPSETAALLGRPLTATETANFQLYLSIAKENLFGEGGLLCISPTQSSGERTFDKRDGYSTVFTGIFTALNSVTVDGNIVTAVPYFNSTRNSKFYNSIILDVNRGEVVVVNADWGFDCYPKDLQRLLAQAFALVSNKRSVTNVKSKKIEDFSVTYGDLTDDETFVKDNARVIAKYSLCDQIDVTSGKIGCYY